MINWHFEGINLKIKSLFVNKILNYLILIYFYLEWRRIWESFASLASSQYSTRRLEIRSNGQIVNGGSHSKIKNVIKISDYPSLS